MRRPAGVSDADPSAGRSCGHLRLQRRDLAGGLAQLDAGAVQSRHPGGIVAAVLQPSQGRHQERRRLAPADITDDAAHDEMLSEEMFRKATGAEGDGPQPAPVSVDTRKPGRSGNTRTGADRRR